MRQPDTLIHRLELLYTPRHETLAQAVKRDIATLSPETEVCLIALDIEDPWDFGEMYGALYDWVRSYRFKTDSEQYWAHITTGTHVAQICLFMRIAARGRRFRPAATPRDAPSAHRRTPR